MSKQKNRLGAGSHEDPLSEKSGASSTEGSPPSDLGKAQGDAKKGVSGVWVLLFFWILAVLLVLTNWLLR